MLTRQKDRLFD